MQMQSEVEERFHPRQASELDSIIYVVLVLLHDSRKPLRPGVYQENGDSERTLYQAVKVKSLDCTGDPKILVAELRDIYLGDVALCPRVLPPIGHLQAAVFPAPVHLPQSLWFLLSHLPPVASCHKSP